MHQLFTGVTKTGKTTLARMFSRELLVGGHDVAVYDPMGTDTAGGDWGDGALVFSDREKFLQFVYSDECENIHLFIDEAHNIFAHTEDEHRWLLTEGRHFHIYCHLMTQRPNKVHPDVRTNCERCFMFRLAADDCRSIGADYGHGDIHKEKLDRGDFLILNSGSAQFSRANVFDLVNPKE
jgi:Zonular occludens toxin (Zot)